MNEIAPGILYLTREDWVARTDLSRLGHNVPRDQRIEVIFHHTVIVDHDATPNLWETVDEVKAKMRQLQTIRPDLGLDVPYSFVIFLMADGTIIVGEGRGSDRRGAHTYGHNRTGIGIAFEGNFELPVDVGPFTPEVNRVLGWLKFDEGMGNLQAIRKHDDFSDTSCPGESIRQAFGGFAFEPSGEENDMTVMIHSKNGVSVVLGGWSLPITSQAHHDALHAAGYSDRHVSDDDRAAIPPFPSGGGDLLAVLESGPGRRVIRHESMMGGADLLVHVAAKGLNFEGL